MSYVKMTRICYVVSLLRENNFFSEMILAHGSWYYSFKQKKTLENAILTSGGDDWLFIVQHVASEFQNLRQLPRWSSLTLLRPWGFNPLFKYLVVKTLDQLWAPFYHIFAPYGWISMHWLRKITQLSIIKLEKSLKNLISWLPFKVCVFC